MVHQTLPRTTQILLVKPLHVANYRICSSRVLWVDRIAALVINNVSTFFENRLSQQFGFR